MKTLLILRHAKSDWNAPTGGDHERPLNPRGVRAAKLMGHFLRAVGQVPDAIISSTAVRARTTVELLAEAGAFEGPLRATRRFYETSAPGVLEEIRRQDDGASSLLVAGHEPTWSGLCELLCGGRVKMVTATLVRLDLHVERWAEAAPGTGTLAWCLPPKLLVAAGWEDES